MLFKNRSDAGMQLAAEIKPYEKDIDMVFGLARGGIPVAYEIAQYYKIPLDVIVVRKLGAPHNPEFGFGALAPDGNVEIDQRIVEYLALTSADIEKVEEGEQKLLYERLKIFRGNKPFPDLSGKSILIVDDGIATGITARVAVNYIRKFHPNKIFFAAPVASREAVDDLERLVDAVICVYKLSQFGSVGTYYEEFDQTTNTEVLYLLSRV